jgi:hypothetical protein
MSFTLVRGLDKLEAFFEPCVEYNGSFMDQLLVAGYFLGLFTYVAVMAIAMYQRNWVHTMATLGLFMTDYVVELLYLALPRVPQYQTTCDPHDYDRPSHNVATCAYAMVYFMAYGAWARDDRGMSVAWRLFLLMTNVFACASGEVFLEVRNPREVITGAVIGMVMGGVSVLTLAMVIAPFKKSSCVKGIGWLFCVEDTRILSDCNVDRGFTLDTEPENYGGRSPQPEDTFSREAPIEVHIHKKQYLQRQADFDIRRHLLAASRPYQQ